MKRIFLFVSIVAVLYSCGNRQKNSSKPTVTVSILPQQFFVHKIADTLFNVNVMVPVGSSPATYEPTPKQMIGLSNSYIYFRIGHIGFEKAWLGKFKDSNENMKIIDTSEGIELINGDGENSQEKHSHNHNLGNPHIWLSPKLVKHQVLVISKALCKYYPNYAEQMRNNTLKFLQEIDSVDLSISNKLKNISDRKFIVFHPVWAYFANEYGLKQISIEHNGKEASVKQMAYVVSFAKENNIKHILIQKEFDTNQAESIAKEIEGKVVVMNPLAYNWFGVMDEISEFFVSLRL